MKAFHLVIKVITGTLGTGPDRNWYHLHTKAFVVVAHGSMDIGGSILHISVEVTLAPVRVVTQRLLVSSFTSVVG